MANRILSCLVIRNSSPLSSALLSGQFLWLGQTADSTNAGKSSGAKSRNWNRRSSKR